MRKLLNTLYVTTPEAYLSKDGLNVVVSVKQQEVFRIPAINIEGIVTFGYMGASPGLMKLCSDSGISLTFLSPNGRFVCRVQGATHGNVLLRKAQYALSDDEEWSLHVAQLMIAAKIQNYRNILRRYIRDYGDCQEVDDAVRVLDANKRYALHAEDKRILMGFEGIASNAYFEVLPKLILNQKESFPFNGWQKRLRKVAKACLDYGQRVQNSVFECEVTEVQLCLLKERIKGIIEKSLDSIRFYHLNRNENRRVEVLGIETAYNVNDAIIV